MLQQPGPSSGAAAKLTLVEQSGKAHVHVCDRVEPGWHHNLAYTRTPWQTVMDDLGFVGNQFNLHYNWKSHVGLWTREYAEYLDLIQLSRESESP